MSIYVDDLSTTEHPPSVYTTHVARIGKKVYRRASSANELFRPESTYARAAHTYVILCC